MDDDLVDEIDVVLRAEADRFFLVQLHASTGELVWMWRRGDDTGSKQFSTRRDAIAYMDRQLQGQAPTRRRRRENRRWRTRFTAHVEQR
jgi:hypothetical protein